MKTETLPAISQRDLFDLYDHTCADCGSLYQTSHRRSTYCALCASLRTGPVGAATVVCPGCQVKHNIPILAPTKLCGPCRIDLDITASALRCQLDAAQHSADTAYDRLSAALAHATPEARVRYDGACERCVEWSTERWQRARDAAIAKGDDLSPLLAAQLAWAVAAVALDCARAEVDSGLAAVEDAR